MEFFDNAIRVFYYSFFFFPLKIFVRSMKTVKAIQKTIKIAKVIQAERML